MTLNNLKIVFRLKSYFVADFVGVVLGYIGSLLAVYAFDALLTKRYVSQQIADYPGAFFGKAYLVLNDVLLFFPITVLLLVFFSLIISFLLDAFSKRISPLSQPFWFRMLLFVILSPIFLFLAAVVIQSLFTVIGFRGFH